MATVDPEELLRLWTRERVTAEMAIGHILQNLVLQHTTIRSLQATIAVLQDERGSVPTDTTAYAPSMKSKRSRK